MKKKIALGLALALAASVGTTAFAAAANPFTDVPAKHWSYNAVQQLAKAGIVEGYNDGQFKGDRTITRYEMAVIVAKAMAKEDKADAAQKAMIDKLAAEFSTELDNLGVRVSNLEKKVGNIKWDGYARIRAEQTPAGSQTDGVKDTTGRTRVRLNVTAPLDTDWTFKGRIEYNSQDAGVISANAYGAGNTNSNGGVDFASAYVTGKALGLDAISVGRVPVWLGQGFIADIKGTNTTTSPDTVVIGKNIGVVAVQYGYGRTNIVPGTVSTADNTIYWNKALTKTGGNFNAINAGGDLTFQYAGLVAPVMDTLTVDASYLKDKDSLYYKTTAFGLNYTGIQNFNVMGEYAQNKAITATTAAQSSAKAYKYQLKYLGADKTKVNTWGTWVAAKKFDTNFDAAAFTTEDMTNYENAALKSTGLKGTEFGVEYTAFKNGVLTFRYEDMKTNSAATKNDFSVAKKGYFGQLEVWF